MRQSDFRAIQDFIQNAVGRGHVFGPYGQAALKGKTGKADVRDEQIGRLKKKVGELTMENELLQEKTQRLEAGLPLARRRSRR